MFSFLASKKEIDFLHGNLIQTETGRYVAYFDEFPEIIVQGDNENDAKERLVRGLLSILGRKRNENESLNAQYKDSKVTHFELRAAI